jgi:hypothetical protein
MTTLQATFLNRSASGIVPYATSPVASSINYNTDVRQFSGTFDLMMEFSESEKFPAKSHDFVEFWFELNGDRHQVGVVFLEDFVRETSPGSYSLKANGRDLIGQLLNVPFKTVHQFTLTPFIRFVSTALMGTYVEKYSKYKSRTAPIRNLGAFAGQIGVTADNTRKRAATLQEYADLTLDLIYQDRLGFVSVYGRRLANGKLDTSPPVGRLTKEKGLSNVTSLSVRQSFSKVVSEVNVFFVSGEKNVNRGDLISPLLKNTDPRAAEIIQPESMTLSISELEHLVAGVDAKTRMVQMGAARIRKSNQDLNQVVIGVADPFYTDPQTGKKTPFEVMQNWWIESKEDGLDLLMTLVGISYRQNAGSLELDLAFVEPDTLV